MVSFSAENGSENSNFASSTATSAYSSERRPTPFNVTGEPKFGGMAPLGRALATPGLSSPAKVLLNEAQSEGTRSTYKPGWLKWCRWCVRKHLDPITAPVVNVINFLAENQERLGYGALNTYRSAISLYHDRVDGLPIGSHPDIKSLMAGAFNLKPPKPRYTITWDVNKVLIFWFEAGPNAGLCRKLLSFKLVSLLALCFAARGHELKLLDLSAVSSFHDKLVFHLLVPTKTSRKQKKLKTFELPKYGYSSNLDPVICFESYKALTDALRSESNNSLFLSYREPYKPVGTATLARWLKETMKLSGIDINTFKAHSTRSAATSKVGYAGLSIQEICKLGDWSNAKTFRRFYCREIEGREADNGSKDKLSSNTQCRVLSMK